MRPVARLGSTVHTRKRLAIRVAAFIGIVIGLGWSTKQDYHSTTQYMCVRCRTVQKVTTFLGMKFVRFEETDYTRWYTRRQPQHLHQWGWCGTQITHHLIAMGRACGVQSGVWQIPPDRQQKFVESAPPAKVEQFYTDLLSHDRQVRNHVVDMIYEWAPEDAQ